MLKTLTGREKGPKTPAPFRRPAEGTVLAMRSGNRCCAAPAQSGDADDAAEQQQLSPIRAVEPHEQCQQRHDGRQGACDQQPRAHADDACMPGNAGFGWLLDGAGKHAVAGNVAGHDVTLMTSPPRPCATAAGDVVSASLHREATLAKWEMRAMTSVKRDEFLRPRARLSRMNAAHACRTS
jgi:hypothetical protein